MADHWHDIVMECDIIYKKEREGERERARERDDDSDATPWQALPAKAMIGSVSVTLACERSGLVWNQPLYRNDGRNDYATLAQHFGPDPK